MYGGNEIHIHKKNLVKVLKTFLLCLSYSDKLWSFEKCDEVHFPVKYTERQTGEDGWRTLWLINNYLLGILENWEEYWGFTGETDAKIKQKLTLKWRLLGFLGGEHIQESALTIFCRLLRISILFQWHEIPWMESLLVKMVFDVSFDWITAGTISRWWTVPGQKHWVCIEITVALWTFNWF